MAGTYRLDIDKIRNLAFKKGLSLTGLCKAAGMSRSRATNWKTHSVTARTVYRIAMILEVDPAEIIDMA